jgi:hypothetical protein
MNCFEKSYKLPDGQIIRAQSVGNTMQEHVQSLKVMNEYYDLIDIDDGMIWEILDDMSHSLDQHKKKP